MQPGPFAVQRRGGEVLAEGPWRGAAQELSTGAGLWIESPMPRKLDLWEHEEEEKAGTRERVPSLAFFTFACPYSDRL